ncbi:MAG: hypothetical protein IPK21_00605 [Haliscomenobacter sp.]|nr:hypothetical protein [Haliscomenobacter sp.]
MAKALWLSLALGLGAFHCLNGQTPDTLYARRAHGPIRIDGLMDESDWGQAKGVTNFFEQFPLDSCLAVGQTVVRMMFDDDYIYVGAVMYNLPDDRNYVTPSLRRDFRGEANDAIVIVFDPFQDNTNAFQFGVNPLASSGKAWWPTEETKVPTST